VAVVTAERTIDRAFELLPQMKGPLPSVIALQATPSDVELLLLRSIEWTMFEDGTYDTALEQAIVILRYFLGARRVSLAKNLVEMLPRDLASIDKPEERATEYFHYTDCYYVLKFLVFLNHIVVACTFTNLVIRMRVFVEILTHDTQDGPFGRLIVLSVRSWRSLF